MQFYSGEKKPIDMLMESRFKRFRICFHMMWLNQKLSVYLNVNWDTKGA